MAKGISLFSAFVTVGICTFIVLVLFMTIIHSTNNHIHHKVYQDSATQPYGSTTNEGSTEVPESSTSISTQSSDITETPTTVNSSVEFSLEATSPIPEEDVLNDYGPPERKMNVLFIMSDDMRAQIGAYQELGNPLSRPKLVTPHLDRLAEKSLLLKNAFAQFSLCGPSRTAILTSRRPDTSRIFDNRNYWREFGGDFTTLPQYFKDHGYRTLGIGKIFHRDVSSNENDPISWTDEYVMPKHSEGSYLDGEATWKAVTKKESKKVPLMDTEAAGIAQYYLTKFASKAKSGHQPFFLALGFKKPHSSYICPKEFYDLYSLESEERFLSDISWQNVRFSRSRNLVNVTITDDGAVELPHETLRYLRRAYFACISYVDSLIGKILRTLDVLGLAQSTIVSFVADHGYHFGENGMYGKQSLYDVGTRIPMMVHIPGRTDDGIVSNSVVEGIDLFPTLAQAAGLPPIPICPFDSRNIKVCTQGRSFLPLITKPNSRIKPGAFSQIAQTLSYMRYTMRTSRFRYTEWAKVKRDVEPQGVYKVVQMNPAGFWAELYDHKHDHLERRNVSGDPQYELIQKKLSMKLQEAVYKMSPHNS